MDFRISTHQSDTINFKITSNVHTQWENALCIGITAKIGEKEPFYCEQVVPVEYLETDAEDHYLQSVVQSMVEQLALVIAKKLKLTEVFRKQLLAAESLK